MAINRLFYYFLFTHLVIWTLIPSITNHNLPLDTIEAQERHEKQEKVFADD